MTRSYEGTKDRGFCYKENILSPREFSGIRGFWGEKQGELRDSGGYQEEIHLERERERDLRFW